MNVLLYAFAGWLAYIVVGALVMAWLDSPERYNEALFRWNREERGLPLLIWPIVSWLAWKDMREAIKARSQRTD